MRFIRAAAANANRVAAVADNGIAKSQAPNPKSQVPNPRETPKSQALNPKRLSSQMSFEHWNLFGAWSLGFGTLDSACVSSPSEDLALVCRNREWFARDRVFPTIQSKLALLDCTDSTHRRGLVFC